MTLSEDQEKKLREALIIWLQNRLTDEAAMIKFIAKLSANSKEDLYNLIVPEIKEQLDLAITKNQDLKKSFP